MGDFFSGAARANTPCARIPRPNPGGKEQETYVDTVGGVWHKDFSSFAIKATHESIDFRFPMQANTLVACAALIFSACAASAQTSYTVSNIPLGGGEYRDGNVDSKNFSTGAGSSLGSEDGLSGKSGGSLVAGQLAAPEPIARESVLFFKLPDLGGSKVQSATLRLKLGSKANTDSGVAGLGAVTLWYDTEQNSGRITNSQAAYGGGSSSGITVVDATSSSGQWYEVDVTSIIELDYSNDSPDSRVAYFRLQMDNVGDFSTASGDNMYVFHGGQHDLFKPELVITASP
jgi:hypothetical protein